MLNQTPQRKFSFSANRLNNIKQNPEHNFAMNHSMMIYPHNALYSFIPKNGCSTLRLSVAFANGCIDDIEDGHWIHNNNPSFNATIADALRADYTFVVLRCPFRRLASVYLDKFVSKEPDAWAFRGQLNRSFELDDLTFREFVNYLKQPPLLNSNIHWKPQSTFLLFKAYDDTFCLENFQEAIRTLKQKIDFEVVDARALTGHGTDRYTLMDGPCFADTKAFDIAIAKREGRCPSHQSLYDDALIETVRTIYRADFTLYQAHFSQENLLFP